VRMNEIAVFTHRMRELLRSLAPISGSTATLIKSTNRQVETSCGIHGGRRRDISQQLINRHGLNYRPRHAGRHRNGIARRLWNPSRETAGRNKCTAWTPELELPGRDASVRIKFDSLDDFHPDALYQKVPLFEEPRRMRQVAADERPAPRGPTQAVAEPLLSSLSSSSLLDDLVSEAEAPSTRGSRPSKVSLRHISRPGRISAKPKWPIA
jgi:hypothetical protein